MRKTGVTILGFLLINISTALGQSLFESSVNEKGDDKKVTIDFNGYGRGSAYGGSKFYDYSSVFGEFALQGKLAYNKAFLFADLRFRGGLQFDSLYTEFELKEAYVGFQSSKFDIYLGEKIISWGRTDGFNPTNNITPNNYFFLTAVPDDQKLPNFLVQAKYHITPQIDLEVIGVPFYRPSIYRYDLFDLNQTEYYYDIQVNAITTFRDPVFPKAKFKNGALAAKFNFELPKIGFSVSWFRGYDPFYGFSLDTITLAMPDLSTIDFNISLRAETYLKNTIGFDFAAPLGSWIIRGEVAYNHTTNYKNNMYIPNPGLRYVAGIEHSFGGVVTILQYIGAYTIDFEEIPEPPPFDPSDPMSMLQFMNQSTINELTEFNRKIFYQQEKFNHALSLSFNKSFAYETVFAEIMGYYNITSEEWFIRPKVRWLITDMLEISAGGFYSAGPDKSIFYYSSDIMNGAFIELKVSF